MIHVIATVELHEGKREAFLAEFRKLIPLVRTEDGCLEYGPTVDLETGLAAQVPARPHAVIVLEKWENLESLKKHLHAPHMIAYRSKVKDYVKSTKLQVLAPAD